MALSSIHEIREALYKAETAKELKHLQDDFYYLLDNNDNLFEEGFELFLEILCTQLLFSKHGINKFISTYSLRCFNLEMAPPQKEQLLTTIYNHFTEYPSNLSLSLCQIIIDITDITSTTLPFFNKLYLIASNQGKGIIYEACCSLIYSNKKIANTLGKQIKSFIPDFPY